MEPANRQKLILLVEDTAALLEMYAMAMEEAGYRVKGFRRGGDALDFLAAHQADLVLLDLKLPDMDGLDLMKALNARRASAPVIVITGYGSVNTAVDAMRHGASDFLVKPFNIERLQKAVTNELEKESRDTVPAALAGLVTKMPPGQKESGAPKNASDFIGTSAPMKQLYRRIKSAARSSATVFITGESGTGKEVCAETVHRQSPRAKGPFIPINCAAIPRDLMESELFGHVKGAFTGAIADRDGAARLADGGTLFLDEIAEMNPDMQTKLLRFVQTLAFQKIGGNRLEKTDIRIICATNRDPLEEISLGRFREDLFYRLHVLPLHMPPLRTRGDDIMLIADAFLQRYSLQEGKTFTGFSGEAREILHSYKWPGNIRQLQNVVRNSVIMNDGTLVEAAMLPRALFHGTGAGQARASLAHAPLPAGEQDIRPLADMERDIIEGAIKACHGNIPRAAAALGVSPSTIYRKKSEWRA